MCLKVVYRAQVVEPVRGLEKAAQVAKVTPILIRLKNAAIILAALLFFLMFDAALGYGIWKLVSR